MGPFTAVCERRENWWIGFVEEIPGANSQGTSLDDVRQNLEEATRLIIEANREMARREFIGKHVVRESLAVTFS